MSTSPSSAPYQSISRSEFLSSLPRWRRWLSMLNWRPVVDLEIRAIEREKQIAELRSDSERIESEIVQLKKENARFAELNAKLAALSSSSDTSSPPPPPTPGPSPT
ncbi:hypothetical protein NZK32_06490 [Cyanobium sp. FGCU-52]|nr:hypothetical protein [Cyanobium sp. FGCU52]